MSRVRKQPITDSYIYAAVGAGGGLGNYDPQTGHYGTLVINFLESRTEAQQYKSSLYRCAHYLARNGIMPVSISMADIERSTPGPYKITFRVSDKERARAHITEEFGSNPANYPYDPRNGHDRDHYRGG